VLDSGLGAALQWLASEFQRHTDVVCEVQIPEEKLDMEEERAMAFFRIVQESLTNVARHARATGVTITLGRDEDAAVVRVRDNGQGFVPTAGKRKSYGLVGMRERALMLGGEIEVDSTPGGGTTVTARIPIHATGETP
jgi:signal transduction histidine kinase